MNRQSANPELPVEAERICAALMQAEIDLASAFLHLATMESEIDSNERAVEFVERAILGHKTVMRHLETILPASSRKRGELEGSAGKLLESIVAAERQFQILRGSPQHPLRAKGGQRPADQEESGGLAAGTTERQVRSG